MMKGLIEKGKRHKRNLDDEPTGTSHYPVGLYRYKTWEEAHEADWRFMIEHACAKGRHDHTEGKQDYLKGKKKP